MGFDSDEAKTITYAYAYPRVSREFDHRLDRIPDVVYNGIWGFCKDARTSDYFGPLTRELVETEKDELVEVARAVVSGKWPEELEWDSDDDIPVNPPRPTHTALGDPPPGWGEGPGEEPPPIYDPEDSWKRAAYTSKNSWPKCPVGTSSSSASSSSGSSSTASSTSLSHTTSTSLSHTTSTSLSHTTSASPSHTSSIVTTSVEATTESAQSSHSFTETEHSTGSFSSIQASTTPVDEEDEEEEEESSPTTVTEPEEPAPTLDWVDESLVGEMTWADGALLWAIPAVAAPIIVLHIPLINGKTLTSTVTNTDYTSYTVTLTDPSKYDLKRIGIATVPAFTTENKFTPLPPITTTMAASTASLTTTVEAKPTGPTTPAITPPPSLNTVHACKELFFTTPKPTNTTTSSKRWIETLPVTSWYYVERNLVASVINSNDVCGDDAPELEGKEGNLDRKFYEGSPESFRIAISWTSNPPTKEQCRENLHHILDGCHGNNPLNPWNWKGGGTCVIGGTKYYEIEPLDAFRRPPGQKWAACRFWLANGQAYAKVWGYGFLDAFDDIDHSLRRPKRIGKGPIEFYHKVTLCLGWDGNWWMAPTTPIPHESALWEWVLSIGFKTSFFANRNGQASKACLEKAIREASGMPDLKCGDKEWDKGVRYFWDRDTGPDRGLYTLRFSS
ncbi:hypothetical protein TWF281_008551 [Arthrobotrys megalospora]